MNYVAGFVGGVIFGAAIVYLWFGPDPPHSGDE